MRTNLQLYIIIILHKYLDIPGEICEKILPYLKYICISKRLINEILYPKQIYYMMSHLRKMNMLTNRFSSINGLIKLKEQLQYISNMNNSNINVYMVEEINNYNKYIKINLTRENKNIYTFDIFVGEIIGNYFVVDKYFENNLQIMVTHAFKVLNHNVT